MLPTENSPAISIYTRFVGTHEEYDAISGTISSADTLKSEPRSGTRHAIGTARLDPRPPTKFKYAGRILAYDHRHRHVSDRGVPYEFKDAQQLLEDFFKDTDRVLSEVRKP
ncbi:MAG: hypothetical protein BGO72_16195 [Burkholderiales bacterium 70-64]|nr:MAG: hypothetical protein BGO72_16195 [Burkholderiales bacterium 70-64]